MHAIVVPGIRGHAAIPPVLEAVPVKLIRAGLDRAADERAGDVAELR
jgi:hypothetical protein